MNVKTCIFLVFLTACSFSQPAVNISGSVADAYSNTPLKGATVRLLGRNMTAVTDTTGSFLIAQTAIQNTMRQQSFPAAAFSVKTGFQFTNTEQGFTRITIHDLTGKCLVSLYNGILQQGIWQIPQPRLTRGVYVCRIATPTCKYSLKFIASANGHPLKGTIINRISQISAAPIPGALSKSYSLDKPGDSLLVTKAGYYPAKVLLDTVIKAGLTIRLTDTAQAQKATYIPASAWTCGMPGGIPPPASGKLVFKATLKIDTVRNVGLTQYGRRRLLGISGGTLTGTNIQATVLTGGLDYELALSNGVVEIEEINVLRTTNGTLIYMRTLGIAPNTEPFSRIVPDFEAPNTSAFAWLNTGTFAGIRTIDTIAKTVVLEVYDMTNVALTDPRVQVTVPAGIPHQPVEGLTATGTRGDTVFSETVNISSTYSVGTSKRGTRNIIFITGGTTSGRVSGKVLAGGADYQLVVNSITKFEARYTLATNDGEFILVRNCGTWGSFTPAFETRANGPYAFLNANSYTGSDPVSVTGGVNITFFARK